MLRHIREVLALVVRCALLVEHQYLTSPLWASASIPVRLARAVVEKEGSLSLNMYLLRPRASGGAPKLYLMFPGFSVIAIDFFRGLDHVPLVV